jgi:hypothetical protein
MRIRSILGAAAIKGLLVFSVAISIRIGPAFADDFVALGVDGPAESAPPPQTEPPAPPSQSPEYTPRHCRLGPFTMRITAVQILTILQTTPGREGLQKILALEENPELPPLTFTVATDDDGGQDLTCE